MGSIQTLLQTRGGGQEGRSNHARSAVLMQRSRSLRSNPFRIKSLRGSPKGSEWLPIATHNGSRFSAWKIDPHDTVKPMF